MIDRLLPRPTAARAASILREVFADLSGPFAFRLWDGTEVKFADGPPASTAFIKRPEIFLRLIRDPSPGNFAEAYVAGEIDLEGDLFAMMHVANAAEAIRITPARKARLFLSMWRGEA